ncbi:MAG: hypothetical protein KDB04_18505 [Acidimicrobiales bacterium]|nr:hypothetical protein [Acidimicrobiales bacterium]HRW36762.1 hypothetical protein [Aquihabitans sp.]
MAQVVACDTSTLNDIAGRLRRIASQMQSRTTTFPIGDAFTGGSPAPEQSFTALCRQTTRARDELAEQLRELARAIEFAAQAMEDVDRRLTTNLGGFL